MSVSALNAGVSGLVANQRALDVAAHNVANANTPGFQPQRASFDESSPAGSGVSLSVEGRNASTANAGAPNGVDLAKEVTDSLVYKVGADLSTKLIKASDQALGSVIDIKA